MNIERSQLTLIFARDISTAGEKCTLNYCNICQKVAYVFIINENGRLSSINKDVLDRALKYIQKNNITSINIAGNGIYTFNEYGITQERVNELVYNILHYLIENGCNIEKIRSGGQTGADEAGLVAGERLGLETTSLCPKGWRFRTANGEDIRDEKAYKARFSIVS
jgi:hypothetical protein